MTDFYIAPTPTGNDSNPGTSGSPFATFNKALSVASPGDTIIFKDGSYNQRIDINGWSSGSAGSILTIKAENVGQAVIAGVSNVLYPVEVVGSSWIVFDGLYVQYNTGHTIPGNRNHHIYIHGTNSNIKILNCYVTRIGMTPTETAMKNDYDAGYREGAINFAGNNTLIEISNCFIRGVNRCIAAQGIFTQNYIHHNHLHAIQSCLNIRYGGGVFGSNFIAFNDFEYSYMEDASQNQPDPALPDDSIDTSGLFFYRNLFRNMGENAIDTKGTEHLFLVQNIFYANWGNNNGRHPTIQTIAGSVNHITCGANQITRHRVAFENVFYDNSSGITTWEQDCYYNNLLWWNWRRDSVSGSTTGEDKHRGLLYTEGTSFTDILLKNNVIGRMYYGGSLRDYATTDIDIDGNAYINCTHVGYDAKNSAVKSTFATWQAWVQARGWTTAGEANGYAGTDAATTLFVNWEEFPTQEWNNYDWSVKPTATPLYQQGVHITTASGATVSSTTLPVVTAYPFYGNFGRSDIPLQTIYIEGVGTRQIVDVDWDARTIELDSAATVANGAKVYHGSSATPDIGAIFFEVGPDAGTTTINDPQNLAATAVSSSQIDLLWINESTGEDGTSIEESADGSTGWTEIDTVGTGVHSYSVTGLGSGVTRYYRVRAFSGVEFSGYSNIDSATTFAMSDVRITKSGAYAEIEQQGILVTQSGAMVEIVDEGLAVTKMGALVEIGNDTLNITKFGAFVEMEYVNPNTMATYFPEPISFKQQHVILPDPVTGYQLDAGGSYWGVVVPEPGRNLVATPSFQKLTSPFLTTNFLTIGNWATYERSTDRASRGFHSLKLTPTAAVAGYVKYKFYPTETGYYTFGLDLYLNAGQTVTLSILDSTETISFAALTYTAPKTRWYRHNLLFHENEIPVTGRFAKLVFNASNVYLTPIYTDGWSVIKSQYPQVYFDGDTRDDGFSSDPYAYGWEGTAHESYSVRSGRNMTGGGIRTLYDLNFKTTAIMGLGMGDPELDIVQMSDGEEILRGNRTAGKEFSIIGTLVQCNVFELQARRRQLIDWFNTLNAKNGGVTLTYQPVNAEGVPIGKKLWMNAAFIGGLAGNFDNLYQENIELRFRLLNGKLYEEFGEVVELNMGESPVPESLTYSQNPRTGTWNTYETVNATIGGDVLAVAVLDDGRIVAGGSFTAIGGVSASRLAIYDPYTQTWAEMGGGLDGTVNCLAKGTGIFRGWVVIAGQFTLADGGLESVNYIAAYNPNTNVWQEIGDGVDNTVTTLTCHPNGKIFISGTFTQDGLANPLETLTYWDGRVGGDQNWHNLGLTFLPGALVWKVVVAPDMNIYFAGNFGEINGDTDYNNVAYFNLQYEGFPLLGLDSLNNGLSAVVYDIEIGPDGYLYAVGNFTFDGNLVAMRHFARYTGSVWEEVGRNEIDLTMYKIVIDKRGNFIISMDAYADNFDPGIFSSTLIYGWNGSSWFPPDVRYYHTVIPPAGRTIVTADGKFFLPAKKPGGDNGQVFLSGYTKVDYEGTADAPVKVQIIGPCIVHRISNWTTGKHIYFRAFELLEDEEFTLDLTGFSPRAFTDTRPNMLPQILTGPSNLNDFRLVPGENHITLLTSGTYGSSTKAILSYHNHYWTIDEGMNI